MVSSNGQQNCGIVSFSQFLVHHPIMDHILRFSGVQKLATILTMELTKYIYWQDQKNWGHPLEGSGQVGTHLLWF